MKQKFFLRGFFGARQKIVELEVFFLWLFCCAEKSGELKVFFL